MQIRVAGSHAPPIHTPQRRARDRLIVQVTCLRISSITRFLRIAFTAFVRCRGQQSAAGASPSRKTYSRLTPACCGPEGAYRKRSRGRAAVPWCCGSRREAWRRKACIHAARVHRKGAQTELLKAVGKLFRRNFFEGDVLVCVAEHYANGESRRRADFTRLIDPRFFGF